MHFTFLPMNRADAHAIVTWEYDKPYSVYSLSPDSVVLDELLDPRSPYYSVRDSDAGLAGFFCFGTSAEVGTNDVRRLYGQDRCLAVGLGLRPDLTGKGLGQEFVASGLQFARDTFDPLAFRLFVLTWNLRAIRVYERCGFRSLSTLAESSREGEHLEFLQMYRPA